MNKTHSLRLTSIIIFQLFCTQACALSESFQQFVTPLSVQVILKPREAQASSNFGPATLTPFQPQPSATTTYTPTVTSTSTLTPSPTSTFTATLTSSPTPTYTLTYTPTETAIPTPSVTSPPPLPVEEEGIPESAQITGFAGHPQISTLDCEARSAVDLAAFFNVAIDEMDFLSLLPVSEDPESGFVGNYWDPRGQIPPNSYGVHAPPVAQLLREFGLNAWERKGMSFDELRQEIAAGRPVMVWVIGNTVPGSAVSYTASSGNTTLVAAFEHTAVVIGYDATYVTLADGGMVYQRATPNFLGSWGVLNNMAVIVE